MLRDWTQSDKVDLLTSEGERFFTRLIMKADDFGCFWGDTRLLKANLFPLKLDKVREADISRWIAECVKAGLILFYEIESKRYIQIQDFRQRLDKAKAKFPLPTKSNDFPEVVNEFPAEVEVEKEIEVERESGDKSPTLAKDFEARKRCFKETLRPHLQDYGAEMLKDFYEYWTEPNKSGTKFRQEMEKAWDLKRRLSTWASKDKNFKPKQIAVTNEPTEREKKDEAIIAKLRDFKAATAG